MRVHSPYEVIKSVQTPSQKLYCSGRIKVGEGHSISAAITSVLPPLHLGDLTWPSKCSSPPHPILSIFQEFDLRSSELKTPFHNHIINTVFFSISGSHDVRLELTVYTRTINCYYPLLPP